MKRHDDFKKGRSDTVNSFVGAQMAAADGLPDIPPFLAQQMTDNDFIYWDALVRGRGKKAWTMGELVMVAQLAMCQAAIERETKTAEGEGAVLTNDKGNEFANPRWNIVDQLTRRQFALMRAIKSGGAHGPEAGGIEAARKVREKVETEDDLLA